MTTSAKESRWVGLGAGGSRKRKLCYTKLLWFKKSSPCKKRKPRSRLWNKPSKNRRGLVSSRISFRSRKSLKPGPKPVLGNRQIVTMVTLGMLRQTVNLFLVDSISTRHPNCGCDGTVDNADLNPAAFIGV